MRIGEIAALVGISTRAVRHYHQRGLLPEPRRRANGYREYGLPDAVVLARIRRLAELGLSLDEISDVLADERDRDLHEILVELDLDLAAQEQRIRDRRARLAELIERAEQGELNAEDAISPDMAALLATLDLTGGSSSPMAALERELLVLLDTTVDPDQRERIVEALQQAAAAPDAVFRGHELHQRLNELSEAAIDDPRVPRLAADLADSVPPQLLAVLAADSDDAFDADQAFGIAVLESMSSAQAEVVGQAMGLLAARLPVSSPGAAP